MTISHICMYNACARTLTYVRKHAREEGTKADACICQWTIVGKHKGKEIFLLITGRIMEYNLPKNR